MRSTASSSAPCAKATPQERAARAPVLTSPKAKPTRPKGQWAFSIRVLGRWGSGVPIRRLGCWRLACPSGLASLRRTLSGLP
jgi:hypothetical protein